MVWWCCCCGVFELRPYQTALATAGDDAMLRGQRPCLVAPTGAGKTVILAELTRRALARGEQVLVLCHREEILGQIVASLRRHLGPSVVVAMVTAGSRPRMDRRVIVGMVPTLNHRLAVLAKMAGCTVLADECHHAPSPSWRRVMTAAAPARMAGLTATPVRPDGKGLGDEGVFDVLVNGPEAAELMRDGKLCRYRLFAAPHRISSKGVKKRGGEFVSAEVEGRVVEINGYIVRDWLAANPQRLPTICVAVSVTHAHEVAELYRAAGISAEAVDGKTPKEERRRIFERFRQGRLTVLVACAVVDEGLDVPEATVLQVLRLIGSLRLWRQLIGRVLRPADGKSHAIILDHTDNWQRLPPPDADMDWRLNAEPQQPRKRLQVVMDEETGEVRTDGELPPVEVEENGTRLVEISPAELARSHPIVARRLLNERCRAEVAINNKLAEQLIAQALQGRNAELPARAFFYYSDEEIATQVLNGIGSGGNTAWSTCAEYRLSGKLMQKAILGTVGLRRWLNCLDVLEDETLQALGAAPSLRLPSGWAEGQMMLRMLLSTEQRLAATKRLQRQWMG